MSEAAKGYIDQSTAIDQRPATNDYPLKSAIIGANLTSTSSEG